MVGGQLALAHWKSDLRIEWLNPQNRWILEQLWIESVSQITFIKSPVWSLGACERRVPSPLSSVPCCLLTGGNCVFWVDLPRDQSSALGMMAFGRVVLLQLGVLRIYCSHMNILKQTNQDSKICNRQLQPFLLDHFHETIWLWSFPVILARRATCLFCEVDPCLVVYRTCSSSLVLRVLRLGLRLCPVFAAVILNSISFWESSSSAS